MCRIWQAGLPGTDKPLVLQLISVYYRESHNERHFSEVRRLRACAVQYDPLD
jgi:hypothetical protein